MYIYDYIQYLYGLEVKHWPNISTNNDKLKTEEHQWNQNKKSEDNKMSIIKLI